MLESIDLSRVLPKSESRETLERYELQLAALQRRTHELGIPVVIVFEGWDAAGKGTLINRLIQPLDPRGFTVKSTLAPNEEAALRPFLWRFWINTPANGRQAIFDRSWYRRVLNDRVDGTVEGGELQQAFQDIRSFERQLAHGGTVIIKFFLHISKKEQKKRFDKLRKSKTTAWRVTEGDLQRHKQYDEYLLATEDMLSRTDSDFAPWTIVEAHDEQFAIMKIFGAVISALEQRVAQAEGDEPRQRGPLLDLELPQVLQSSVIDQLDLTKSLERSIYKKQLKARQKRLRDLEHEIYLRRIPVILAYEGSDAAGKGGNIRRLTAMLDPRGYEVVPIGAPNDIERQHHYLWRFWNEIPKAGHITIFDRTWYGRVLVERVEGFCGEAEWKRAYREINEMEEHLTNYGVILLKFWLQIDQDEQLARFQARKETAHKQWKITDEDWRNREKWLQYKLAVDEMLVRTSSPRAPWTVVESNNKHYARIKVLDTVIAAIEARVNE